MIFNDIAIKNLFATPLITSSLSELDAKILNAALAELVLKKAAESQGVHISNDGGWQSDDQIMVWGGEPVKRVVDGITELLAQITLREKNKAVERVSIPWRVHGWANVNRKTNANAMHCHPGAFWSAVYYVQTAEEGKGGELELTDPRGPLPIMYCPELRMGIKGYVSAGTYERHTPVSGQMVIFPSWLNHAVTPYTGDGTRISLAFNFSV